MGDYADLAALKVDVAERLRRNALDRARHEFSDKIIEYAVANATIDLPDVLVDQEVEVMHDEFRTTLGAAGHRGARVPQGHGPERGGPARGVPPPGRAAHEGPPGALRRSPTPRAWRSPRARSRAQVKLARARYEDPKTVRYFESERGRNFIRSTLRRTRTVECLVDRWLAAHPEHPALPHVEDDAPSAIEAPEAEAAAAIDATDPGAIPGAEDPAGS